MTTFLQPLGTFLLQVYTCSSIHPLPSPFTASPSRGGEPCQIVGLFASRGCPQCGFYITGRLLGSCKDPFAVRWGPYCNKIENGLGFDFHVVSSKSQREKLKCSALCMSPERERACLCSPPSGLCLINHSLAASAALAAAASTTAATTAERARVCVFGVPPLWFAATRSQKLAATAAALAAKRACVCIFAPPPMLKYDE